MNAVGPDYLESEEQSSSRMHLLNQPESLRLLTEADIQMLLRRPKMVDQETQTIQAQQKMENRSFASKTSMVSPL